jgi:hypothetical protein
MTKNLHRLTLLQPDGTDHHINSFEVTDENTSGFHDAIRVKVCERDIPSSLSGHSPKDVMDWDIVVTYDGNNPRGGRVSSAEKKYNRSLFTIILD